MYVSGTRSALSPKCRSVCAVAGPMAAMPQPESFRSSNPRSSSRPSASSTPFAEVKTSQPRPPCSSEGESPKSSGTSLVRAAVRTSAPRGRSRSHSRRRKLSVPVSATRTPASGPSVPALNSSAAASPTTMTAGASAPASRAFRAISASVPRTHRGFLAFPPETTAAGVPASIPASMSRAESAPSLPRPMRNTSVPCSLASVSMSSGSSSEAVCAVTTWKLRARPRCVTGMPASSGMAMAELTPGTSSQYMPASLSAANSSPPRPNTKGSPPLSRTTRLCLPAQSMSRRFISS